MKVINAIGNGTITVKGYSNKIEICKSTNSGRNWVVVETIKCYGSMKKCNSIFNALTK